MVLRPVILTALATALVLTSACSDDSDPGEGGAAGGAGAGDGPTTLSSGLASLPAGVSDNGDDSETITWSDLARAAEVAGVTRPDDLTDTQAVVDYVNAITGGPGEGGETSPVAALPPEVANFQTSVTQLEEFRDEVGWTLLDVDTFVEQVAPPVSVTVMGADVDGEALDSALGDPDDGTWSVGTPGEVDVAAVSPARRLGEALFLTEVPGGLAVTRSDDLTSEVRDVAAGDGESLADDEALAALGAALDDEDAYSAMLVRPGLTANLPGQVVGGDFEGCEASIEGQPLATATAIADDGGPIVLVAHAYGSAEAASTGAESLERVVEEGASLATREPWSDLFTVDEVTTGGPDGTVAVARLRPAGERPAAVWRNLLPQRETLVAPCAVPGD